MSRKKFLALLRNGSIPSAKPVEAAQTVPRALKRTQVASRLSRSLRFVDLLCETGVLKRVTAPGRQRSMGITEESVNRLIAGGAGKDICNAAQ